MNEICDFLIAWCVEQVENYRMSPDLLDFAYYAIGVAVPLLGYATVCIGLVLLLSVILKGVSKHD